MIAQFVLFDGFDALDIVAPYEVLGAGGIRTEFVSAEGPREVPSGDPAGLSLKATAVLDPAQTDLVIVPGGLSRDLGEIKDILAGTLRTPLPGLLKQALDQKTVGTVCGGSLILAMAGLIKGRTATTHHLALEDLAATGVNIANARVVDDGNLITAGAVTAGTDLAVYLLERYLGAQTALAVEQLIGYERRGTVWRAA